MARTLAALVPMAIQGVVRDVALACLANAPRAREIADHAGCVLAEAGSPGEILAKGLAATRGDLVFLIRAGSAPETGLVEEIVDLFDRSGLAAPRAALLRASPETFLQRLFPGAAEVRGAIVRKPDMRPAASLLELSRGLVAPVTLRGRLRRVA